jgi:alpha-1,6-mannosyltransferase
MPDDPARKPAAFWLWLAPAAALLCTSSSWVHFLSSGSLQLQEFPMSSALYATRTMATIGLVLLGVACVAAYRASESLSPRRVLVTALIVHVVMLGALPLTSTDLFSYLAYGEMSVRGMNPHRFGPEALGDAVIVQYTQWRGQPSVYGPVADFLMSVAGHVAHWTRSPIWGGIICYKFISGALDICSLLIVYRLLGAGKDQGLRRGFVLFAMNPILAWEVAGQAHNDGLVVFFVVLAVWAGRRGWSSATIGSLTLGTLSKFVLGPALLLSLRALARTDLRRAALLALGALALAAILYVPALSSGSGSGSWLPPQITRNFEVGSLYSILAKVFTRLHAPANIVNLSFSAWAWGGRLVVGVLFIVLLVRVRTFEDALLASLIVLLAALATSAAITSWYLAWVVPFAAVQKDRRWQDLTLAVTVAGAPAFGFGGLWLLLAASQAAVLVALWRWRAPLSVGGVARAQASAA